MAEKKVTRLQFTDAELTPKLKRHVRRAEKAAEQVEKAEKKIPKDRKKVKRRMIDQQTGKAKKKLYFEGVDRPAPASKLTHEIAAAPVRAVTGAVHREIARNEDDNVGVESVHKLEEFSEAGVRLAAHSRRARKLKPYREAEKARMRLAKANVDALYQKHLQDDPDPSNDPISRWRQKRAIKKQYAASVRSGQGVAATMENAAQAGKEAAEKAQKTRDLLWRHKKGLALMLALLLAVSVFLNGLSSCSVLAEGLLSALGSTTYPSRDANMLGAEAAYSGLEAALKNELDHYATLHPGHDQYIFDLDEIGHDPYVLISLLTAYHRGGWTLDEVRGTMEMLFERQYTLTETVTTETRYDENDQPYEYSICKVTLTNSDLSHLPVYVLDEDGMHLYATYMSTLGNRPDLFPTSEYPNASRREDYLDYDVPSEALEDETFAAMLKEAEKYLGYPYVWGGTNPSTSFDCSGFVSWVINHSGWNYGRLGVMGLEDVCTPVSRANAKPGDLVFFIGTYDAPYPDRPSHVGIYVGNGMMIHCGSPISYANINTPYWQDHFYGFGRLREP